MIDYRAATEAIIEGRLHAAWQGSISLVPSDQPGRLGVVEWYPSRSQVVLHRTLRDSPRLSFFAARIPPTLAVLEAVNASAVGPLAPAVIPLNLDDAPAPEGIAYVSTPGAGHLLIPDPNFIRFNGYADLRQRYARPPHWKQRIPVVFWRGGTSGRHPDGNWRRLPRLELCRLALREPMIDAGITHVAQLPDEAAAEIAAAGLRRARVPAELFHLYRAHIAIDGNSWPSGLYGALLTGSPVLKVGSAYGFYQWYYDRLKPWTHYVPVEADLSDLPEKAAWVLADGQRAAKIGEAGRAFAHNMTPAREIGDAARHVARVLSRKDAPATREPVVPSMQSSIIEFLLRSHADKTRLIFVHIPKCAGTDLSFNLKHFPAIHETIQHPNWQKPDELATAIAKVEQSVAQHDRILVHGHIRLQWVVNRGLNRPGDRLFTIVRNPEQQLISNINYIVGRLIADPMGNDPDTALWLRNAGLSKVDDRTPAHLLDVARSQLPTNSMCTALGDGTASGALALIRESAIEITDTDRYRAWGEATWGVPFTTRHNASQQFITQIDQDTLIRHCDQDIELYKLIRTGLGDELLVHGDAL